MLHRHIAPRFFYYASAFSIGSIVTAFIAVVLSMPQQQLQNIDSYIPPAVAVDASNSVSLAWTAPGDDGSVGTAAAYLLRYTTGSLSEGTWSSATSFSSPPAPSAAATGESVLVTGLTPKTTYSFGIKSVDEAGNVSSLSNVVSATTACYEAWSCGDWSACSTGTQSRTCVDMNGCGTTTSRPATTQSCSCTESWSCSAWSACSGGVQTRTCTDAYACGTTASRPETTQICGAGGAVRETYIVAGESAGGQPLVRVLTKTGALKKEFLAYEASFRGGVNVAAADMDGDGIDEIIVAPGAGREPLVKVFHWNGTLQGSFMAYDARTRGGVNLAVGDVNGQLGKEIITSPASGAGPHVRIWGRVGSSYTTVQNDFFAYGTGFRGETSVAVSDVDGNGSNEILTVPGAESGGPQVRIFQLDGDRWVNRTLGFFAYDSRFRGGVSFAVGNLYGDGQTEILTSPVTRGGPHIRFFGRTRVGTFGLLNPGVFVFSPEFRGGVSIAAGEFDGNPANEEFAAAVRSGDRASVRIFNNLYTRVLYEFNAFPTTMRNGVRIAAGHFLADY